MQKDKLYKTKIKKGHHSRLQVKQSSSLQSYSDPWEFIVYTLLIESSESSVQHLRQSSTSSADRRKCYLRLKTIKQSYGLPHVKKEIHPLLICQYSKQWTNLQIKGCFGEMKFLSNAASFTKNWDKTFVVFCRKVNYGSPAYVSNASSETP